jgi:two-component system nitrogen regulation sensor histidine kinase NtrY
MVEAIQDNREAEQKRRQREFYIILFVIPAIILITFIETHLSFISGDIPIATNIFVLGLININIILLVLLIFLILRNAVKLFFESKRKVMGSKLSTKLVAAFVGLTIVPTLLLFFVVIGFINKSIDSWFDIKIEDSLKESLKLAQNYYRDTSEKMLSGAQKMALTMEGGLPTGIEGLTEFTEFSGASEELSTIEVFSAKGERAAYSISPEVNQNMVPDISLVPVAEALGGNAKSFVQTLDVGDRLDQRAATR